MDCIPIEAHVADPARLAALQKVALLDTPTEEAFDRLTRLASQFVSAPVALVTLVDANRQFFKSCLGLPEPWLSMRQTPLSHSFCQYNRFPFKPMVIRDAREHPFFKNNPAIRDLGVIAYLGIPLFTSDGYVLGSFCVIDSKPRSWARKDIKVVQDLAAAVMTEIELRTEMNARIKSEEKLHITHDELREAYQNLEKETSERIKALEQLRQRDQLLINQGRLAAMGEMIGNIAHQWRQPLNTLALYTQELPVMLKRGEFSKEYLEANVQKMMETISYMSRTIDNFRNFFSPGKTKVNFTVSDILRNVLSLLEVSLEEAKITIHLVTTSDPVVSGYPAEYSQVLLNILVNAKDALVTRNITGPAITIEVGRDRDRSVVTISDNGGGIPAEIGDKIFDPYFTTKGPGKGTGLGLYISKVIIEKNMGGALTFNSVSGGSQFKIVV